MEGRVLVVPAEVPGRYFGVPLMEQIELATVSPFTKRPKVIHKLQDVTLHALVTAVLHLALLIVVKIHHIPLQELQELFVSIVQILKVASLRAQVVDDPVPDQEEHASLLQCGAQILQDLPGGEPMKRRGHADGIRGSSTEALLQLPCRRLRDPERRELRPELAAEVAHWLDELQLHAGRLLEILHLSFHGSEATLKCLAARLEVHFPVPAARSTTRSGSFRVRSQLSSSLTAASGPNSHA